MKPQILLRPVLLIALIFSLNSAVAQLLAQPLAKPIVQPLSRAESNLCRQLQIIDSFSDAFRGPTHDIDAYDSIGRYDSLFGEMLQQLTDGNPASLHYPFTRLQNQAVAIATSSDGRLRIYSWDGQTGGSAHNANNVYQYEIDGKVYSTLTIVDGGPGDSYSAIYLFKTGDKTYYLAVSEAIIANLQLHATLEILQLEGHRLQSNIPLIRTASGTTGTLGFDYTLDNDIDAAFHFNPATGTITVPVVLEDGHVTKRKITYSFNGKYFVRTNN
jgi:hypothetical protein